MFIQTIKRNKILLLSYKIIRILFLVFLLDLLIGGALEYMYFNQKSGRQYRAYYTIEKTTADILIFGSSRAYNHYRPDVFENRLQQSFYNSGSPGQFLLYDYATLKAVLKRYSPKLIILELMPGSLAVESDGINTYDRLSFLYPYYKQHEEMRPVLDLKGRYEKIKLFSSIYPYNSSVLYTVSGYLNLESFKELNKTDKGYQASFSVWNKPSELISPDPVILDSVKVNVYKNFINDCRKAGTNLFIVCSPMLNRYKEEMMSLSVAKKIAEEQNVKFIDFINDSFFAEHPELFAYDPIHLNHEGAGIFCNRLIDSISNQQNVNLSFVNRPTVSPN